jgi:hypothetical protein
MVFSLDPFSGPKNRTIPNIHSLKMNSDPRKKRLSSSDYIGKCPDPQKCH